MITYAKLWALLESKGMKRTDLKEVISGNTLAKLGKNETVSVTVIEKICGFLDCQPGDIMAYISEKSVIEAAKQLDNMQNQMAQTLKEKGISEEEFANAMAQVMPELIKNTYAGGSTWFEDILRNEFKKEPDGASTTTEEE